jgi:mannose-6-phosphate isomerase-like protein (cupin superfamily)
MRTATKIEEQFHEITAYWSPKIIGQVNNQYVKVAKVKGELAWHDHKDEDELFLVLKGKLVIQFQDGEVELNEGDFYIVPKGVMHNPIAEDECCIVLIETVTTKHTGDVETPLTKTLEQQLQ